MAGWYGVPAFELLEDAEIAFKWDYQVIAVSSLVRGLLFCIRVPGSDPILDSSFKHDRAAKPQARCVGKAI